MKKIPKILIVEDDIHINELLCELLVKNGYSPVSAFSGTEAMLLIPQGDFGLVLLDLMLPGKTGEDVLAEIRKQSDIPIIVITARADKETTTQLLRAGADDYVSKPFDNNELLARIEVRLRSKNNKTRAAVCSFRDLRLDFDCFDVVAGGKRVNLSKREFEIMKLMMSHPSKVFTKNNLYESVWGGEFLGDDNTISVHISNIRAKLEQARPEAEYIQTVWGIGYKMKE